MAEFSYNLTSGRNSAPLELYAVQGEAGSRSFQFQLRYQDGTPGVGASDTAYAYVLKNDGHLVVMDCVVSAALVTFTLPLQACTCPGYNRVYIQVLSGSTEARWDNIRLFVEPCDLENAAASTDDLGPLANIIADPEYLSQIENAYTTAASQLEALMDSFAPMGEYNPETSYQKFNVVTQSGSSYIALGPTQGNAPPNAAYWQLLASKGDQGQQGTQGPPGEKGDTGEPGQAATIQVGSVSTGEAGAQASVRNSGTSSAAVLDFVIPQGIPGQQGEKGEKGNPGPGLEIAGGPYETTGNVPIPETGNCYLIGTSAPYDVYYYDGTDWINLGPIQGAQGPEGPQGTPGQAATVQVGQVTTGEPGSQANVTNSGTEAAAVLNFTIPQGPTGQTGPIGRTPIFSVGTVTTLEPTEQATASITGTDENPVLNLGIPQGQQGTPGQAGITAEQVIALVYPVGAVFTTTNSVNPGTYLSGTTWELFGAGKTLIGVDTSDTDFNAPEKTGGAKTVNLTHAHAVGAETLDETQIPYHTHSVNLSTNTNSHTHQMNHDHSDTFSIASSGAHTHDVIQPSTLKLNLNGNGNVAGRKLEFDSSLNDKLSSNTMIAASAGSHTHTINGRVSDYYGETAGNSHSHTVSGNTGAAGSSLPHDHGGETGIALDITSLLSPYITVYFWKRTA